MALSCVSPFQVMSQLSTIKNKILKINSLEKLTTAALLVYTVSVQARTTHNMSLVNDDIYRGISQTDNSPAIQDGSVYKSDNAYASVWFSNVDFDSIQERTGFRFATSIRKN
jgi:uncharacterized protein (TIGR02001 family)